MNGPPVIINDPSLPRCLYPGTYTADVQSPDPWNYMFWQVVPDTQGAYMQTSSPDAAFIDALRAEVLALRARVAALENK